MRGIYLTAPLPQLGRGHTKKIHAIANGVKYVRFYREIDGDNQRPLIFPCGSCIAFS